MKTDSNAESRLLSTSQRNFRALVEAAPLAIVVLDHEGTVRLWNPAAEQLFGWSAQEAMGKFYPVVQTDKHEEFMQNLARVMAGETIVQLEVERQRKDGTLIWISGSATPIKGEDGSIQEIMVMVSDISETRQIQAMLMKSEERYRFLIECSIAFICIHKLDGTLQLVNTAAAKALGYTVSEMQGRNIREFMPKDASAK